MSSLCSFVVLLVLTGINNSHIYSMNNNKDKMAFALLAQLPAPTIMFSIHVCCLFLSNSAYTVGLIRLQRHSPTLYTTFCRLHG